ADADLEQTVRPQRIRCAISPPPEFPASQCQPGHKGAKDRRYRVRCITEYKPRQPDPDHFVNESSCTRQKKNDVEYRTLIQLLGRHRPRILMQTGTYWRLQIVGCFSASFWEHGVLQRGPMEMHASKAIELQRRLVVFAGQIVSLSIKLRRTAAGRHMA